MMTSSYTLATQGMQGMLLVPWPPNSRLSMGPNALLMLPVCPVPDAAEPADDTGQPAAGAALSAVLGAGHRDPLP